MERIRFDARIDAPVAKVWDTMLRDDSYRDWTTAFMPGSYYVGDWSEGSRILFLAPGDNGEDGMVARIRENRPHAFISIEHLGLVRDGQEDTTSKEAEGWAGAREEYSFREVDGRTELHVEMDTDDSSRAMFESMWPRALDRLKTLAEQ